MFIPRSTNFASMRWSSFSNSWWGRHNSLCWQCIVYYIHQWKLWNGNTWPLYVHMGLVIMHGRPDITLVGLAAHDVFAPFFPYAWQMFVEFMSPQQFNWFWYFTLHLTARSLQGCNIKSTSPQGWSWSQSMIPIPASPILRFSDHCVGARGESKSFEIIFLCRSVRKYVSLHIGRTLGNSYLLANLSSIHQCMPPVCRTLYIKFQLQIMTWLTNELIHK